MKSYSILIQYLDAKCEGVVQSDRTARNIKLFLWLTAFVKAPSIKDLFQVSIQVTEVY